MKLVGELLHVKRIDSPSTRFGDRNGNDPSHSGTTCTGNGPAMECAWVRGEEEDKC
jgi:hypothetical protein